MDLATVFGQTSHVDGGQECARAALVFGYRPVAVRIAGRPVFGTWSAVDITREPSGTTTVLHWQRFRLGSRSHRAKSKRGDGGAWLTTALRPNGTLVLSRP